MGRVERAAEQADPQACRMRRQAGMNGRPWLHQAAPDRQEQPTIMA
jgi:hypothetical protein